MSDKNVPSVKSDNPEKYYPLLMALLRDQALPFLPFYSTADVARIYGVCPRSILYRVAAGKLVARDLPGKAKHLPQDLEDDLRNSKMGGR
jgi:hypothetical protein